MQNDKADISYHRALNYPDTTIKLFMLLLRHCDKVELFLNGKRLDIADKPIDFVDALNPMPNTYGLYLCI